MSSLFVHQLKACSTVCHFHSLALQAERWGSELLTEDVEHVDLSVRPFVVRSSETEVRSTSAVRSRRS